MLIILSGGIGRSVTGGQAWANLQYLIGLKSLGHDVYYLEDCGEWSSVYDWDKGEIVWNMDYPGGYIAECLEPFGLGDRWMYRAGDESIGLTIGEFEDICRRADLLLIRGIPFLTWRPEYDLPRCRLFLDVDPGFTQFSHQRGEPAFVETIARSDVLYTIGQNTGRADCPIPDCGRTWLKTVSPVVLGEWPAMKEEGAGCFTSVVRWQGMKDMKYQGVDYGQRNREFSKFIGLPQKCTQRFEIAVTGGSRRPLEDNGWNVIDGWTASKTPSIYQQFIQNSRAEFGVAKNTYVDTNCGWFSDRSACYLASARPVLVQDTSIASWLPTGRGVVTFRDLDSAVSGIEAINNNYSEHQRFAREIAEEYFSAAHVLPPLLESTNR